MDLKEYTNLPDLTVIEANLDKWLYYSQVLYEDTAKRYAVSHEAYIESELAYNNKLALTILQLRSEGEKVTLVKDIAKAMCAKEYKDMLTAKVKAKRYDALMSATSERLNTIKKLIAQRFPHTA